MFADVDGRDFRICADSPCVNVGTNTADIGTLDKGMNARVYEGIVDMGAYELWQDGRDRDGDGLTDWDEFRTHGTQAGNTGPQRDLYGDPGAV